ncbi:MAG: phenylacetyl-CoA:acceptor oxidoreductase [Gammaproteobacteria bacterium]
MTRFGSILQVNWDWRAAGNFMFGGTGSSLMFMTALAYYPATPNMLIGLSALAFVGLGLFLVWLEIGRPLRFLHVYFHPQRSWMTREAFIALVLFALALVGVLFKLASVIALAGLCGLLFLYCQGRILKESKGIPAWREPAVVPLIIATGLSEGTAIFIILTLLLDSAPAWANYLLLVFIALRLFAWNHYRGKLAASDAPGKTRRILANIHTAQLLAGTIIPAILIVLAITMANIAGIALIISGLLIVLSGWQLKFTIVARASQVQGYALGKLRKGRPTIRPPVRRKPDKFVF